MHVPAMGNLFTSIGFLPIAKSMSHKQQLNKHLLYLCLNGGFTNSRWSVWHHPNKSALTCPFLEKGEKYNMLQQNGLRSTQSKYKANQTIPFYNRLLTASSYGCLVMASN
ncbi:hypothetical protein H5410_007083 [Solanum commersonii]|uniref:Uncharacterized protein n=1 Tax=Solanum commersonii TaxID=4109 RepID=A0A9J6ABM2_SOLCO|nr:hypothetical protein H5410_007083 [Solanum commersonii]